MPDPARASGWPWNIGRGSIMSAALHAEAGRRGHAGRDANGALLDELRALGGARRGLACDAANLVIGRMNALGLICPAPWADWLRGAVTAFVAADTAGAEHAARVVIGVDAAGLRGKVAAGALARGFRAAACELGVVLPPPPTGQPSRRAS